jgi:hypothetical protein
MEKLKEILNNTKIVLGTISIIVASLLGGYTFVSDYFVTKVYAKELEDKFTGTMRSIQKQTQQNSIMIIELKLTEYEKRLQKNETLTPTEKRQYQRLLKIYDIETRESNLNF